MSNNTVSLDILIADTHNTQTFGIADISVYPQGMQIVNPTVQITPPTFERVTLQFTAKNMTIYNSTILKITCDEDGGLNDLPDGIWKIKYTITPSDVYFVEKTFLRTELIQRKFGKAFLSTELSGCGTLAAIKDKDRLDDVYTLIQGAIADANMCNETESMNKYRLADSILNNFFKTKNIIY